MLVRLPLQTRLLRTPGAGAFSALLTIDCVARAMLMTIIPLEALSVLGNARDVSILYFGVSWGAFAGRFLIPMAIGRFRRRWVYSAGLVMLAVSPMLIGLAVLPGLAAGMLLRAFGAACVNITLNLYIMDYVQKRDLVRVEPLKFALSGIAWGGGPLAGVLLWDLIGPWPTFAIATSFSIAALGYFWYLRLTDAVAVAPMTKASPRPFAVLSYLPRFFRQPRLVLAWLIGFGRETWWVLLVVYGPIYVVRAGGSDLLSAVLVSAGNAMMFSALLFGWIGRRHGIRRVIMAGFAAAGVLTCLVPLASFSTPLVVALLLAAACAITACDSVGNVPFMRTVRKRERPEMTMVYSTYSDVSSLVPSAVFSVILTFFELPAVFLATGLAMFLFAWIARWVPRGM